MTKNAFTSALAIAMVASLTNAGAVDARAADHPARAAADDGKSKKKADKKQGKKDSAKSAPGNAGGQVECAMTRSTKGLTGVSEASGIAIGRRTSGILWSHGDTGPAPTLHAFDLNGVEKGKVRIDAKITDWEDIAAGPCGGSSCLYVADIGDNAARRANVAVLRFPEPLPTDTSVTAIETFHATFPDGPHDAEAFFVTPSGDAFIVTKGETGGSSLYRFPSLKAGSTVVLQKVGTLHEGVASRGQWITGASASPDGRWIALRTHGSVFFHETSRFLKGDFASPLVFGTGSLNEPQGEGVALGAAGALYLAGEGGGKGTPGTFASGVCKLP